MRYVKKMFTGSYIICIVVYNLLAEIRNAAAVDTNKATFKLKNRFSTSKAFSN